MREVQGSSVLAALMSLRPIACASMRYSILVVALLCSVSSSEVVDLDDGNTEQIFTGEWMVMFYAPWCPACQRAKPEWKDFSSWGKDLGLHVGQSDVTKNPGLSGRFMITALPSIFHIKDGVTRHYSGSKASSDLVAFVDEQKWKDIVPVVWWMAPETIQMRAVGSFFSFANLIRGLHTTLTEGYDIPSWGVYVMFAVTTILLGLALGFALVLLLDCICPQKPPARASAPAGVAASKRPAQQPAKRVAAPAAPSGGQSAKGGSVPSAASTGASGGAAGSTSMGPAARLPVVDSSDRSDDDVVDDDDVSSEEDACVVERDDAGHEEQDDALASDERVPGGGGNEGGEAVCDNGVNEASEKQQACSGDVGEATALPAAEQEEKEGGSSAAAAGITQPAAAGDEGEASAAAAGGNDEGEAAAAATAESEQQQQTVRRRNKPRRT